MATNIGYVSVLGQNSLHASEDFTKKFYENVGVPDIMLVKPSVDEAKINKTELKSNYAEPLKNVPLPNRGKNFLNFIKVAANLTYWPKIQGEGLERMGVGITYISRALIYGGAFILYRKLSKKRRK